ncbi:putative ATP-binding protein MJ0283 [Methanobacterium formicicum]|uniref:Iron-sulfur cluster carrier protein n=2 Tax=Methanobacterium formicicum TaxID=2162 RepID=A0A089ZHD2_METFO|nr:ParA/MinD family protein [Methanobacterium formicicum]CEL25627.1 putative ATP-binding protein MJ0283 [Methanobacterium formicicum]
MKTDTEMKTDPEEEHKKLLMQQEINIVKRMSDIGYKIAVMSGKGGVGKSTIAVNLAAAFALNNYHTGIMDVDLHGPDVPHMLGIENATLQQTPLGISPVKARDNLEVLSIEFMLPKKGLPVIWRGPKKTGAIRQFLSDVSWGNLDVLVVDNPPGTGDEPLTVLQSISPLDGVVMVTTPQAVAGEDVRKCVNMVKGLNIPILGIIENMSGFICPHCQEEINIFGKGEGKQLAEELEVPYLGSLPLQTGVREKSDQGQPFILEDPDSEISQKFMEIVSKIENNVFNPKKED